MDPARLIATWFGAGLSPWAPGTAGTLAAVPLYAVLCWPAIPHAALPLTAAGLALVGVAAGGRVARLAGMEDPPQVVIDEVAGYLIACSFTPRGLPTAIAAFASFRLLDILKPGPIAACQGLPRGWGIVADDVLAGLLAGAGCWTGWFVVARLGGAG